MAYPVHYVPAGDVLPILFSTYDGGTGASLTMTGLAVTDIEIYRDGGTTQRASDAGYTLLDTDGIDFDGLTGIHGFSIDTGDNTDAGFYTVGSWFHVVVSAVTVDAQTVSFVAAAFRIMAAEGVAGVPDVNATHWNDTAVTTPPAVNVTQISGDSTAADNLETAYDDTAGAVSWAGIVDQGTAQSATGTTLVLRSAAAFANDELIGATLVITGGTGAGQSRVITDYVSSTDTATVDTWTTTPSGTITYKIFATPPASATAVPAVNLVQVAGSTTDVSALATNVAAILVDTGTTLDTKLNTIDDFLDTEVAAVLAAVDTEVAAILADTNELQTDWANGGRLDLLLDGAASAGDPWTTSIPGAYSAGTAGYIVGNNLNAPVGTVDTVVDAIKVKTDQLTFTAANKVDANILNVNSQDIGATKPYDTAT